MFYKYLNAAFNKFKRKNYQYSQENWIIWSNSCILSTLEDNIRKRGAIDKLISNWAQVEKSKRVCNILRALFINDLGKWVS